MDKAIATLLDPAKAATEAEFEELWEQCLREAPPGKILAIRKTGRTTAPRVGTITERSSAANQRKITALMATPPPPPPRRRVPTSQPQPSPSLQAELEELFGDLSDLNDEGTTETAETPATTRFTAATELPAATTTVAAAASPVAFGPVGPPPVKLRINGHEVLVPYFAATINRKYRARIGGQRFVLRFNRAGDCTYARRQDKE